MSLDIQAFKKKNRENRHYLNKRCFYGFSFAQGVVPKELRGDVSYLGTSSQGKGHKQALRDKVSA